MSEAADSPKPRKPKRRFLRFGLKTLLIFTAIVAAWLGIITNRANRQRRAVEAITALGGEVWYDYQEAQRHESTSRYTFTLKYEIPGPEWLRNLVGDHYFITPICVSVLNQEVIDQDGLAYLRDLPEIEALWVFDDVQLRNEDLLHFRHLTKLRQVSFDSNTLSSVDGTRGFEFLSKCPNLRDLTLEGRAFGDAAAAYLVNATEMRQLYLDDTLTSDEGLTHFGAMSNLEALSLKGTSVTDAGLVHLKSLTQLSYLGLSRTEVTDAGLEHLKSLAKLERVLLYKTQVTEKGAREFEATMPNCIVLR